MEIESVLIPASEKVTELIPPNMDHLRALDLIFWGLVTHEYDIDQASEEFEQAKKDHEEGKPITQYLAVGYDLLKSGSIDLTAADLQIPKPTQS